MEFGGDIEDIWKNEVDEKRIEKTEVTLKKKKCCSKKNKETKEECKTIEITENKVKISLIDDSKDLSLLKSNSNKDESCGGCNNTSNGTKIESGKKKEGCCNSKEELIIKNELNLKISEDSKYSIVPGTQKIYVKTYGCSHNTSDSEYMMGLLNEYGYKLVEDFESADACVINSCTVKNPSQDAFINYISKAKKFGKKVIVSGCVPQGDRTLPGLEDCSVVGVTQIDRIVEVVEETLKGNTVKLLAKKELPSLDLPKIRRNAFVEIIPINTGCLGSCTYCKTKHARGKLGSYDIEAIVNSVLKASKEGVKEIWLTSEDTGAYGRDINTDLPNLMMEILKVIPEDVMIRVGMTNPPYIMEHLEKMAKILNHPNCFSFLHIPVQAGSNLVLDKMNREYKIEDFNLVCDYIKAHVPNVTLATDIICGFPSETKEQFDETLELIERHKFPVINISQFYPRPGTVAAKWKRVDTKEVKRRSTETAKLFFSYPNYEHLKGTIQRVWVHDNKDEGKSPGEDFMIAHTKSYAKVLLKRDIELLGKQILVKITEIHKWHVFGDIIDKSPKLIKVNFNDHFKGLYNLEQKDYSKLKSLHKNQINIHDTFNLISNESSYSMNFDKKLITQNIDKSYIKSNNKYSLILHCLSLVMFAFSFYCLVIGIIKFS